MIKKYFLLAKPGIIFGNAITTVGGFAMAAKGHFNLPLFLAMLAGVCLIIASACTLNNCIDRKVDEKMARTRHRPLVTKSITLQNALLFALLCGLTGFGILLRYTNPVATFFAFLGFFVYVPLYSLLKYRTVYGTLIGSISGAAPPVIGYTAVTHTFDMAAFLLFIILVLWQMPHFFALAVYRLEDYTAAAIPVLPVKRGIYITKIRMLLYILAFIASTAALTLLGYTGYVYLIVLSLIGIVWVWMSVQGFKTKDDKLWAKAMFRFSLIAITVLSLLISVDVN